MDDINFEAGVSRRELRGLGPLVKKESFWGAQPSSIEYIVGWMNS